MKISPLKKWFFSTLVWYMKKHLGLALCVRYYYILYCAVWCWWGGAEAITQDCLLADSLIQFGCWQSLDSFSVSTTTAMAMGYKLGPPCFTGCCHYCEHQRVWKWPVKSTIWCGMLHKTGNIHIKDFAWQKKSKRSIGAVPSRKRKS